MAISSSCTKTKKPMLVRIKMIGCPPNKNLGTMILEYMRYAGSIRTLIKSKTIQIRGLIQNMVKEFTMGLSSPSNIQQNISILVVGFIFLSLSYSMMIEFEYK